MRCGYAAQVSSTEKSRALRKRLGGASQGPFGSRIGRRKRRGEHITRGYAEEAPLRTPRPPPERPKTVPKVLPSTVSREKAVMIKSLQHVAVSEIWPSVELEKSQSTPNLRAAGRHLRL